MRKIRFLLMMMTLLITGAPVALAQEDAARTSPPNPGAVVLAEVARGFTRPLYVTHAGDGSGRLFVVEQGGLIWILEDGVRLEAPFLDLSTLVSPEATRAGGYTERGLLGLAFDPNYAENGRLFVNYTDASGTTVIARYLVSADDLNRADPASGVTLLTVSQPYPNHNGGHMAFGPDGYLYVAMGDGGSAGDPLNSGQTLSTVLGKLLRLDVSAGDSYSVPADNPFVDSAGAAPEIWAYGLRNPWRFSFDRATGDLYIGDVGQNQWEEINFQPANSAGGENYGWNVYEASRQYTGAPAPADMVLPIAEYSHNEGISVSAGYVYRGQAVPELTGVFLYGDFGTGNIWGTYQDGNGFWQTNLLMGGTGSIISSFGEDEAGEVYVVDYNGRVLRFESAS